MPTEPTVLFALVGTIFGGAGLKVIEYLLNRGDSRAKEAVELRGELWQQIKSNKEDIARLKEEVDTWKIKYYELREELVTLKADIFKFHYDDNRPF